MTDYTVISRYRNKEECEKLIGGIIAKGKSCYNFFDNSSEDFSGISAEERMKVYESDGNFLANEEYRKIFLKDLDGLKNAEKVILLLPAGTSSHIEAGIAYGMGKELILVGEIEKPESLYFIFKKHYKTIEDFLESI